MFHCFVDSSVRKSKRVSWVLWLVLLLLSMGFCVACIDPPVKIDGNLSVSTWCLRRSSRWILGLSDGVRAAGVAVSGGGKHTPIASTKFLKVSLAEYRAVTYYLRSTTVMCSCDTDRGCHQTCMHSVASLLFIHVFDRPFVH